MIRSAWLTWKMHRFEVAFGAILLVSFAVTAFVINKHLADLNITSLCWPRDEDGNYASPTWEGLMTQYWNIMGSEVWLGRIGLAFLAPIAGLILGVPIVAREIELRTTSLAWSLALRRSRWLLARFLPMLAVAVLGFVALAWLGDRLFEAMRIGQAGPDLTEVASFGPALLARGLLALGVALLAGALVGRTLPALLLAAAVVVAWSLLATPLIQRAMFDERSVWRQSQDESWRFGDLSPIAWLDGGEFDASRPGQPGEPGARVDTEAEYNRLVEQACGPWPDEPEDDESVAWQEWYECSANVPYPDADYYWQRVVPASTYSDFQLAETLLGGAVGGLAILLTFPVVARRKPA
jgi:hypothetical protein